MLSHAPEAKIVDLTQVYLGACTSMHNVVLFGHFLSIDLVGMSINFSAPDTLRVVLDHNHTSEGF
jgi:hypothetical protein